jgi:hypothetical protein
VRYKGIHINFCFDNNMKPKEDLVQYASQKVSTIGKDLYDLIKSLPSRTYRDSADVAIAIGELKSGKEPRTAEEVSKSEQPSKKVGVAAATTSISAAPIAKVFAGIDLPKRKDGLKEHAKKNIFKVEVADANVILNVLDKLPDREYNDMVDVEKSVGSLI